MKEEQYDYNKTIEISAVSKALSSIYTGVFLIDLEEDRFEIVHATKIIGRMLNGVTSAQGAINLAIKRTVSDEEILDMLHFVNLSTLPGRMERGMPLHTEYKGIISGWIRGSFIEVERDENGKLTQVLYVYQVIDEEKRKELEHLQNLKDSYDRSERENLESRRKTASLEEDKQILEDDLLYRNHFNQIVLEQLDCGVLAYTVPGRSLLEINREALRIFGWKDKEEAAINLVQNWGKIRLIHPTQEMELLNLRKNETSVKYQFIINEGQRDEKQILAETKSIEGRYGGRVIMSTLTDVTNVKNLEADKLSLTDVNTELQRATDAVHTILNAGSYLCVYAEDGETLLSIKFSDSLRNLYGYTDKEDAPDTWNMWLKGAYPEDRDYVARSYEAALRDRTGKTNYDVTFRAVKKDGSICWYRAAAHIIRREDGTAEFSYGLILDVDEQKRASDQIEAALYRAEVANAAKTSFLSRMSHDIRTPMNGIMGLIEINERHSTDMELVSQNRKKAKIAANHLLSLINDVLQLSKLEDTDIELSREPFCMLELRNEIMVIVEQRAREKGITVVRDDDSSMKEYPYVYGSPLHVKQIFINILGNAIKYNKENGSIFCHTSIFPCKDKENTIRLREEIRDTGIGMSEEFLQHLFEPFTREKEGLESGCEGTGLGLSIVKQLVEKMDGTIQVTSRPGTGSCFTVEIPFEIASEDCLKNTDDGDVLDDIRGAHILLTEDNELNMDIAEILLMDSGARVTKATNGKQALEIFKENEPGTFDAILMDVMMPLMNGYEATRQIRALERSDAKEIPIIAITANAFKEDVDRALKAGMTDHLSKPLNIDKLKHVICSQISIRSGKGMCSIKRK